MRVSLVVFLLTITISSSAQNADITILRSINHPVHPGLDATMRGVTNSVPVMAIALPAGITIYDLCTTRLQERDFIIAGAVGTSAVICFGLKYVVNRPRPFVTYSDIVQRDFNVGPYSFPSGHTSIAFSLATSASLCFPKWYVIAPAYLWAGTVAYSRMRLGVHYPTDVLAGALIGAGSAVASYYLTRWIHTRYFTPKIIEPYRGRSG